jgi:hypothetical protein
MKMTKKNDPTMPLSASAAVNVTAKKSQSLIVIFGVTVAILCFIGCFLLYVNHPLFWFPFVPAGIILTVCTLLALLTHKNTDLAGAQATVIESGGPGGFKIMADPRVDVASKNIIPLITVLANMHTLPQASGLVDKNLNPIPDTEQEAIKIVESINSDAQVACSDAMRNMASLPASEPLSAPVITISESAISHLVPQEYTQLTQNIDIAN